MILSEQYRPHTWGEVAGQAGLLEQLSNHRTHGGLCGRAYFLVGPPGCGKTTIARLIAAEVAELWAVEELDAAKLDVETCDRWEREAHTRPIGGKGWAKVVNEAGSLRKPIVKRLLTLLEIEAVQRNMTVVFTTMPEEQKGLFAGSAELENAFGSRVESLVVEPDLLAFAARARAVAHAIGQDGKTTEAYYILAVRCEGNLREMLRRVEKRQVAG
jgi:replication-associated recombination protein RarA